jgi:DNA replication protein DnaC
LSSTWLDDWGLEPLTAEQRHDLLEIVEDRYGRGATLITSQIPVDRWHDLIGDSTLSWCLSLRSVGASGLSSALDGLLWR